MKKTARIAALILETSTGTMQSSASCFMVESPATKTAPPLGQSLARRCGDTQRTKNKTYPRADELPDRANGHPLQPTLGLTY